MDYKQAYQSEHRSGCGPMGRSKFGGHWGRGKWGGFWGRHAGGMHQPPVNIEETDTAFVISLYAAGLIKENVTLTIKDNVLKISYPGTSQDTDAEQAPKGNFTYQEYNQGGFERSFQLNNKVLTESITAQYADGVLKVTLPKNPETNQPAQTITVA
ncbi:Hsp20/alpha crystallin family protein [Spirosoma soli]|uniref:Hsp20/alpha crystallin family protein n=1 Tax=Spirosoma soli TaxID=1770529 RepID=A0ABW5MD74_9BACT